jgi:hypothetical protein
MSLRPFSRLSILATSFVALYFGFVACGSEDGSKHAMEDGAAGEGGAAGGDAPSSGGSQVKAGSGGGGTAGMSQGGVSGTTNAAGAAGSPEPEPGGANAGGMATSLAGQTGSAGSPIENGGAAGEAGAAGAAGSGEVVCDPPTTLGSRITMAFDTSDAERVTNLQWLDSSNATTANVAASGGPVVCGDPQEFFGASYGAPEGSTPYPVIQGSRSTALACGLDVSITSTPTNCNDQPQIPTTTQYHFYDGAKASQLRVTRTLGFDANSPQYSGIGVRVWESRVPLSVLPNVIYPDANDMTITTVNAGSCGGDCFTPVGPTWNGKWFAKTGASGLAMIVVRDPSVTSPVDLTVNYDSYSNANIASFVVLQPQGGWKAPITEIEYVCFADLTSWPQATRDLAQLPAWCGP